MEVTLDYVLGLIDFGSMLYIGLGVALGVVVGAIPGLTAPMGIALLLPLTYAMPPVRALGMLIGVYVGGISGGAIPAVLLNIPGTPAAVATCLDGHPMAKQGRAAEALGWAVIASVIGGLLGGLVLMTVAPQLAQFALRFGPAEYAALAVLGLTIIAGLSAQSQLKGLLAGLLGITLSFIGLDPVMGYPRFTFGSVNLLGGISLMPALIGIFALPEILSSISSEQRDAGVNINLKNMFPGWRNILRQGVNLLRSSAIGVIIGMIPATGSNIASFLAYQQAQRSSRRPEQFGQGAEEGLIAAESANNGVTGGALIPMLTLGIPGDSITAVLIGGLMIHGLQPGPGLFRNQPDIVHGLFASFMLAALLMGVIQFFGVRAFIHVLRVPKQYLAPMLLMLAVVGSYSLNNSLFDVWVMLLLGLLAYVLSLAKFPMAPIVLGLVLGPILESEARRALVISGGNWTVFFTRPISLILILISVLILVGPSLSALWHRLRNRNRTGTIRQAGA